tara:strand:- start:92 stop:1093 length:1002 start_codon:yes stop_codon:yes gene_type:complete
MIITKSPFRIAFAGGGTDIKQFSDIHGGEVINATINLGCYTFINDNSEIIFNSQDLGISEKFQKNEKILKLHHATYLKMMKRFNNDDLEKISLTTYSEVPPGSGVGASSSMVVSMVCCLAKYLGKDLNPYEIAELAYEIERVDCNLSGGKQDQYSASFGGFNHIEFQKNNNVSVTPIKIEERNLINLQSNILIFYTGQSRSSEEIIDKQKESIISKKDSALESLLSIKKLVKPMKKALISCDLDQINKIFNESWRHKKLTSDLISNNNINSLIEGLLSEGAKSAKISGAGGGGFMVIITEPQNRQRINSFLSKKVGMVYNINFTDKGAYSWQI